MTSDIYNVPVCRVHESICRRLPLEPATGTRRLQFLLLEYSFFMDSAEGSAVPLTLPSFFSPLSLVAHIIKSRALVLLSLPCYFVKLETRIVGLCAIQEKGESLFVASLGVSKARRRLGIGTCMLDWIEAIAKSRSKGWLEVDVLRKNVAAQQFYAKYGFTFIKNDEARYVMRGKKPLRNA